MDRDDHLMMMMVMEEMDKMMIMSKMGMILKMSKTIMIIFSQWPE